MLMAGRTYSVREMSELARCSIEQLLYYEEIRLLLPWQRSDDGWLAYDDLNLLRAQQIRIGRSRGWALEEIRRGLEAGARDLPGASRAWPPPLRSAGHSRGSLYVEAEVKAETEADREAFQEEAASLYRALSLKRHSGLAPSDERLRHWVCRHRWHIDRWFCPCEADSHSAFGRAMVNNSYLAAGIERHGRQLTSFLLDALEAHNPLRAGPCAGPP